MEDLEDRRGKSPAGGIDDKISKEIGKRLRGEHEQIVREPLPRKFQLLLGLLSQAETKPK